MRIDTGVNSGERDVSSRVTADRLTLYFSSDRSGGTGDFDIYVATRPSTEDPFGMPEALINVNRTPWLSPAGRTASVL